MHPADAGDAVGEDGLKAEAPVSHPPTELTLRDLATAQRR
jgi:hypothetical protein